jgi:hypothetical protein
VREQKQRASAYPSSWDTPIFRSAFEERRLRILNALFTCLTRCGMTPRVSDKEGRELSVIVGDAHVPLVLDSIGSPIDLPAVVEHMDARVRWACYDEVGASTTGERLVVLKSRRRVIDERRSDFGG